MSREKGEPPKQGYLDSSVKGEAITGDGSPWTSSVKSWLGRHDRWINIALIAATGTTMWWVSGSLCLALLIWLAEPAYWPLNGRARAVQAQGRVYWKDALWWVELLATTAGLVAFVTLCLRLR